MTERPTEEARCGRWWGVRARVGVVLLVLFWGMAVRQGVGVWREMQASSRLDRSRIHLPAAPEEPESPRVRAAPDVGPADEEDTVVPGPPDWHSEENVRAAAVLLLRHGRAAEAVALLRRGEGGAALAEGVARSLYVRTRERVAVSVRAECARLRVWLAGQPEEARVALLRACAPIGPAFAEAEGVSWQASVSALPAFLGASVLENAVVGLPAAVDSPPEIAAAVLRNELPSDPLLRALVGHLPEEWRRHEYGDSRVWAVRRFSERLLLERLRGVLRSLQGVAGQEDAEAAWLLETIGADAVKVFSGLDPERIITTDMWLASRSLPEEMRVLWGEALRHEVESSWGCEIPSWLRADVFWFRPVPSGAHARAARWVSRHPGWRADVQSFAYEEALARVPKILGTFGLGALAGEIGAPLRRWVAAEREALADESFDWEWLRRRMAVEETMPPPYRRRPRLGLGGLAVVYSRWEDVPPGMFRAGIRALAARTVNAERKAWYEGAATAVGRVRGLFEEEHTGDE